MCVCVFKILQKQKNSIIAWPRDDIAFHEFCIDKRIYFTPSKLLTFSKKSFSNKQISWSYNHKNKTGLNENEKRIIFMNFYYLKLRNLDIVWIIRLTKIQKIIDCMMFKIITLKCWYNNYLSFSSFCIHLFCLA